MKNVLQHLQARLANSSLSTKSVQHRLAIAWLTLLQKWNATYNLSGKHDPIDIIDDLIVDSLAGLHYLRGEHIADIGSGAGVPGLILAIYCPDKHFTLIDRATKKARFMEHCRITLGLDNISVQHTRVEDFRPKKPFSTIVSKAFGKATKFISASRHLGDAQSVWLTYKNDFDQNEFKQLPDPCAERMQWHLTGYDYQCAKRTRKLIALTLQ